MVESAVLPEVESPPVIDYEGSSYKTDFWVGQGREYEDLVERRALAQLMPARGLRIAEIGAGFGRLADQYLGYEQIILFDYSRTLLEDAARKWGHDPRFVFVAGNIYALPLANGSLDTLVMIRVMHHLAAVPDALRQIKRVLHRRSVAVLEYANKRNLKALVRWMVGRQSWSPMDEEPIEFVALNFDFHPAWMSRQLRLGGLTVARQYGVSHLRMPVLKQRVPSTALAQVDSALFGLGGRYPLAPSIFVQVSAADASVRSSIPTAPDAVAALFRCPVSGAEDLQQVDEDRLYSPAAGLTYLRRNGVWDFKEPLR